MNTASSQFGTADQQEQVREELDRGVSEESLLKNGDVVFGTSPVTDERIALEGIQLAADFIERSDGPLVPKPLTGRVEELPQRGRPQPWDQPPRPDELITGDPEVTDEILAAQKRHAQEVLENLRSQNDNNR